MTTILVSSGTTVVSTTIPSTTAYVVEGSGTLEIASGGTVSGLISVSRGGTVVLESGGSTAGNTTNLTVSSGGTFEFIGLDTSAVDFKPLSGATIEFGSGAS